ncbi:uncharacterized protein LOC116851110 [Odontomachus brunneus]|uniref:uncharacterized protein LOC116851110 n=1 Tax=Odontomachus brunneus TaxID=486640 RepID=UPI0013F1DF38|nr:uncharacterized protein LOC116851110 [Odontomachus brunneus]
MMDGLDSDRRSPRETTSRCSHAGHPRGLEDLSRHVRRAELRKIDWRERQRSRSRPAFFSTTAADQDEEEKTFESVGAQDEEDTFSPEATQRRRRRRWVKSTRRRQKNRGSRESENPTPLSINTTTFTIPRDVDESAQSPCDYALHQRANGNERMTAKHTIREC